MNIYLNSITGIEDALTSLYISKRHWTIEKQIYITNLVNSVNNRSGKYINNNDEYNILLSKLLKIGQDHITLLRYIDISITVDGLHRAGQDDFDSHASRFNNRIVRSSTRLSEYNYEQSSFYQNKIIPTDIALSLLDISLPEKIQVNNIDYIKTINGYIQEELQDDKDIKRGLYMLSIPSTFIFKINLCEFSHIYKLRGNESSSNPEVKILTEKICDKIQEFQPLFTRELLKNINN